MLESSPLIGAPRVRVVVPCLDEAATVGDVVRDFLAQPGVVEVLVVDNGSRDGTAAKARGAGARVIAESRPGKGFALVTGLRQAGAADYYVMVDGDDTYPADALPRLLEAAEGADMVLGTRLESAGAGAFRAGHDFGNRLFIALVRLFFRHRTSDLFSGYRVLSRRFVDTVPLIARGFEIELELSLQALSNHFRIAEVPVEYKARPRGSASKLRTYADGLRILRALVLFVRDYRPMAFFGALGAALMAAALAFGWLVVSQYLQTGQVLRIPLAVLSAALFLLSSLSLSCGALLASINRRATELATLIRRQGDSARER
jgi:glycosyltransferase involved in cell wall biosynthesis